METQGQGVRIVKNVFIPMRDGVELAADLFLPSTEGPAPAVFTYVPYHKDDYIGVAYKETYMEIARRGYAGLLIDIRGTGGSGGKTTEIMSLKEQEDGYDAIEWIAAQEWCNGRVGQWGMSYGGFTSLLVAAQQPPHLEATVPTFAGMNIYLDFSYPGGRFNMLNMSGGWCAWMLVMNAMPPMYRDDEGRWLRLWTERLEDYVPYLMAAMDNPTYNDVWKQGSPELVCDKIEVPTLLIGGWRDIFADAMVRCYGALSCPKKLIMGPWMHDFPNRSLLPRIDAFGEIMRWFDHHLKGRDTGVMEEPPVSIYVQGLDQWRFEEDWPIPQTVTSDYELAENNALVEGGASVERGAQSVEHDPTVGAAAGLWNPFAFNIGLPMDQREDEAKSLSFTSQPLEQDLEIAGSTTLKISVSTDIPDAVLVAKLCDVAPDGGSTLISSSWLDMTHRESHESPSPISSDEIYRVEMALWATSYLVRAGHRIRLNIATGDFPRIWPSRHEGRHTIYFGGSDAATLSIPIRLPGDPSRSAPPYEEIPLAPLPPEITFFKPLWNFERDLLDSRVTVHSGSDREMDLEGGARLFTGHRYSASARRDDPAASTVKAEVENVIEFPDMEIVMEGTVTVNISSALLTLNITLDGHPFYQRTWTHHGLL